MKLAYTSGKYTDARGPIFAEFNICHAAELAVTLWSMGIAVICPHTNTKHFDGATDYDTFLEGDLVMVERCDLMVMVDNWQTSRGAKMEKKHAEERGIPVFVWPADYIEIIEFCWPDGMPQKYIESCKNLLPETLYDRIANEFGWNTKAAGGVH